MKTNRSFPLRKSSEQQPGCCLPSKFIMLLVKFLVLLAFATLSAGQWSYYVVPVASPPRMVATQPPAKCVYPQQPVVVKATTPPLKQAFNDRNSCEVNPQEMKKTFPPKQGDRLMPPCCGKKASRCDPCEKYRRLDGSCNNLQNPEWGLPNSTYGRLLPSQYSDGISAPRMANDRTPLPGPRALRVDLFPTGQREDPERSIVSMQWGQVVAHDMSLLREMEGPIRCCTGNGQIPVQKDRFCFPIKVSPQDPTQGQSGIRCMNFTRTVTDRDMGCAKGTSPASQINAVTSYLDLSLVYGNDQVMSNSLRSMKGGELTVEVRGNRSYPPRNANASVACFCNAANENACYSTGDSRMNQSPHLAILQILLLREHNRLARGLKVVNPHWNDERLFQEARKINIAQYQRITYYEWMPTILGSNNLVNKNIIYPSTTGFVNDYNTAVPPDVTNEHAHAAFRHFHTQIAGSLRLIDDQRTYRSAVTLSDWINRPQILEQGTNIEQLTIGLITQPTEDSDQIYVNEVAERMFACRSIGYGVDLKATDIQRDRDHGLKYYNDYRRYCGLRVANSFDDFSDYISKQNIALLKRHYKSHLDVDLSVGGSLESKFAGAQVGPTYLCILLEQFKRTRQSDRFWFENSGAGFTTAQLAELRKSTLARLFCDNGDGIKRAQLNVFLTAKANSIYQCNQIPVVNLAMWKEARY